MSRQVDSADVAGIINAQRNYFLSDATKPVAFRRDQLAKLKAALKKNESRLNDAIHEDFSKSPFESYLTEFSLLYHEINIALKKVGRWSRPKRVRTNLANQPGRSWIYPEPPGNTLVIGAWNYPYQLSFAPAVAALAAGNTVILKPSELPANSSAVINDVIRENFDAEYLAVVEGGVPTTTALLDLRFDKIFFTGSVPVGRIVYQAAARHLTPVTLELGGKSPTFVLPDCNLDVAARRIVWGKFLNAGQTCIAPDYVLAHSTIKEELLDRMKKEIQRSYGDGISDHYVQIVNDRNFDRLSALIDDDKVFYGGTRDRARRYIEPTLMHNVTFEDTIMQDEIFGPILPVIEFDQIDSLVDIVKRREKPLACYIFSSDKSRIDDLIGRLSFGGGAVNDTVVHLANGNLPFGGVGESGIGNYHAEAGFRAFSHYKSVLRKPFWGDLPFRYPPYSKRKKSLIRFLVE